MASSQQFSSCGEHSGIIIAIILRCGRALHDWLQEEEAARGEQGQGQGQGQGCPPGATQQGEASVLIAADCVCPAPGSGVINALAPKHVYGDFSLSGPGPGYELGPGKVLGDLTPSSSNAGRHRPAPLLTRVLTSQPLLSPP